MSIIRGMLNSSESLFRNEDALDYSYMPKVVPYREQEQRRIASCIRPLFAGRCGRNCFVFGPPGVGKTVGTRHLLGEIEEETDEVHTLFINCWQHNTSYKIAVELCDQVGYRLTHNKKTEELLKIIKGSLNESSGVIVFDEIDKAEETSFLYSLLEDLYRKSIVLITNYKEWLPALDERIRSRLLPEMLEFPPYDEKETKGILNHRKSYAFVPGVWRDDAFDLIAKKTSELKDIRSGLYLMRSAGSNAEDSSSRIITIEHAQKAITKLDEFSVNRISDLAADEQHVMAIIRKNPCTRIGSLFDLYKNDGGSSAYKTFQRRIERLKGGKFISVEKTSGGSAGNTTIVRPLIS